MWNCLCFTLSKTIVEAWFPQNGLCCFATDTNPSDCRFNKRFASRYSVLMTNVRLIRLNYCVRALFACCRQKEPGGNSKLVWVCQSKFTLVPWTSPTSSSVSHRLFEHLTSILRKHLRDLECRRKAGAEHSCFNSRRPHTVFYRWDTGGCRPGSSWCGDPGGSSDSRGSSLLYEFCIFSSRFSVDLLVHHLTVGECNLSTGFQLVNRTDRHSCGFSCCFSL